MHNSHGVPICEFVCKQYMMFVSHPNMTITRHINDSSTTNLHKHVLCCMPEDSTAATKLKTWAHGSTYTCEDFRTGIVSWVVNKCRPFAIIEDEELHALFLMLDPQVEIPSRHLVQHDIMHLYDITQKRLSDMLKVSYHYTPLYAVLSIISGTPQSFTYWPR